MDYVPGSNVDLKFNTFQPSTGAPFTLAGTPVVSVYKDNSTTQSTAGVTLTVDFDTVTGLHHVRIDTSADGTFYSAGSTFYAIVTTGTVDSVSAVGLKVGDFRLAESIADQVRTELTPELDEIEEIKSKTDNLTFTVAGQVDANTESMNGAEILGNGTSANKWRGE